MDWKRFNKNELDTYHPSVQLRREQPATLASIGGGRTSTRLFARLTESAQ
jgi:hypothetical protein